MPFVNPLDILDVWSATPPDYATLRTARRRKDVEFQLSDVLEVRGVQLSKGDFDRLTSDLDDPERIAGYHALQRHPELEAFLSSGDPAFFDGSLPSQADAALMVPAVGSEYAARFGAEMASALRKGNAERIAAMRSAPLLYDHRSEQEALRPVEDALAMMERDVQGVMTRMKRGSLAPRDAASEIRLEIHPVALNALPDAFTTERIAVAQALRNLGVSLYNDGDDAQAALWVLQLASRVEVPGSLQANINEQLKSVREIRDRENLTDQFGDQLADAAATIEVVGEIIAEVEAGKRTSFDSIREVIDVVSLNALPDELRQVREQVAFGLRQLSIAVWNENDDATQAKAILALARKIRVGSELQKRLAEDATALHKITGEVQEAQSEELATVEKLISDLSGKVDRSQAHQINWNAVDDVFSKLLGSHQIALLTRAHDQQPERVRSILRKVQPVFYGLLINHESGAAHLAARLRPLIHKDPEIAKLFDLDEFIDDLKTIASQYKSRSSESDYSWVWILVIVFVLFLLCNA